MGRMLLWALAAILVSPMPLLAYLDPISGSLVFQVIAAAALGGVLAARRLWAWIWTRFWRITGFGE